MRHWHTREEEFVYVLEGEVLLRTETGEQVLRVRLGPDATIDTLAYGESIDMHGVRVSLHPAGHVRGACDPALWL